MPQIEQNATVLIDETDKIASLIATARQLLNDDKMVDLSALEGRVADLCQRVEDRPGQQTTPLRDALNAILADLDRLATDLTRQNEAARRESAISDPKKATQAYSRES